ncbi:MAG: hypothetical protein JO116_13745, partial [Planctomycetaceae bacterium]|nr:hypothetical protein [Planctomycetaceae bacterium]
MYQSQAGPPIRRRVTTEEPTRPGPVGGHAPPDGEGHPRRPPRAAPPHPPRDRRPDRRALGPTRSGPARSATTPHPTARATPAARPGPLHPTR